MNTPYKIEDLETGSTMGEVVAMSGVVHALMALATEFSFDIDVSTPEGMFIPARQRFQQVVSMLQYWEGQLTQRAQALNVGMNAMVQFNLRRRAKLTNRLVPLYKEREVDDPRWPQRLYPPIPTNAIDTGDTANLPDVIDVTEALSPSEMWRGYPGVREIGWSSLGTSGGWPP
jgi:hypothetical protein